MMTPPFSHHDRAGEAASYADRLQADLINITGMLGNYKNPAARLEELRDSSEHCCRQLDAISKRLDALSETADSSKYALSDPEHAALDAARDLRDRMMDALSDLQQAERSAHPPQT